MNTYQDGLVGLLMSELKPHLKERKGKLYYDGVLMGMPSAVRLVNRVRYEKGLNALTYPGVEV